MPWSATGARPLFPARIRTLIPSAGGAAAQTGLDAPSAEDTVAGRLTTGFLR
ncbi:hypothetical protein [Streptomyces sp. JHA26]|uniref:hypothetical protein n=1 Tax=Streptomyces sp. JHA26 TaxID=1917143 RepID=UPI0015C575E7|nr:hypothetical protein [Streptomyces sp. JHA26]